MATHTELESFLSADGKRRLTLHARADGLYSYGEERYLFEDMSEVGLESFWYWSPYYDSGLYGAAEDALRDARATTPWLRDLLEPPTEPM